MFYETYNLVSKLVVMTWGGVNCFVQMLLSFSIFIIKCLVVFFFQAFKKLNKIPESKPDQKQISTEFQKFSSRK